MDGVHYSCYIGSAVSPRTLIGIQFTVACFGLIRNEIDEPYGYASNSVEMENDGMF